MAKQSLTMAQLRARLYRAIDDVATGELDPNRANAIAKLAAQMNQTLLTEVEIARLNILRKVDGHDIGALPLGESGEEGAKQAPTVIDASPAVKRTVPAPVVTRRDVAPVLMGDPVSGRSALDHRNAGK